MLTEGKGPFGMGRELKQGVTKDEFGQVDQNLTESLETQREEKIRLSNHLAHIFSTIAKLGALLAMQPELFVLIDVCSGMAEMAIKKSVAGEAYDPADDAKLLAIDAVVDIATLGAAKLAEARKLGALGKDAVVATEEASAVGDKVATKALETTGEEGAEKTVVAEAKAEAVEGGATNASTPREQFSNESEMKRPTAQVDANGVSDAETATKSSNAASPAVEDSSEIASDAAHQERLPRSPAEGAATSVTESPSALGGKGTIETRLENPEAISVDGASGVSKGPNYERFEQEAKAAAAEQEAREAAQATEVKTFRRDGEFEVHSKYDVRTYEAADGQLTEISIDVHFKKGPGITEADVAKMRGHATEGIDKYYNFKDGQRIHMLPDGSKLHVRVNLVEDEAAADLVVSVEHPFDPMTGHELWTHQTRWLTTNGSDGMAAHELSHQMGLIDEYEDLLRSPYRVVMPDNSLMGAFEKESGQLGGKVGVTEVKPRHINQIAGDIDRARASEVAATKVTAPMEAVSPPTAVIDESKAAAETQRMETHAGPTGVAESGAPPVRDESIASAETQQMPAQRPEGPKSRGTPEKQLTEAGATKPVALSQVERARVDVYTAERNKFLKESREGQLTNLRGSERADVDTACSAIRDHMTPDDIAGAIKEERGVLIERGGVTVDHVNEVEEARLSVVTAIENIKARMKAIDDMGYGSAAERDDLVSALSELSKILDQAEATR